MTQTKHLLLLAAFAAAACSKAPVADDGPSNATVLNNEAGPASGAGEAGTAESSETVSERAIPAATPAEAPAPATKPGACDVQDGAALPRLRMRAVGTEPFWGARIEGRCVTYSHPDNQKGTRVWTQYSGKAPAGAWSGMLEGSPFLLRTRAEAGCSDGMSDRRYPIAVTLTVSGQERQGCAEPL